MKHHTQQSIDDSIDRKAQSQRKRLSYIEFATLQSNDVFSSDMMCFGRFTTSQKNLDNHLDEQTSFPLRFRWAGRPSVSFAAVLNLTECRRQDGSAPGWLSS